MIKKIISTKIFFGLLSLIFVYINYSKSSWTFFNNLGGLALAKVGPEITGIIFFALLSLIYIKTFYRIFKVKIEKREWFTFLFFLIVIFIYRYKQLFTYFYHDDFYLVFNRLGTGYSKYLWGPWLSSFPLWAWEVIRSVFGYSILPYQIVSLLSHFLLSIGVYFLSKYLSKNYYVALIISFFVLTTTISFEAFQWLIHPINFAWQGFVICLSLIALVWEIEKNKGKAVPYLSLFLMMSAFGAGIARIGFILPLVTCVDILTSIKYLNFKKINKWIKNLIYRQWIFYVLVFIFFSVRELFTISSTKTEYITTSLVNIYLYVIGIFVFPIELFINLSKLSKSTILPGTFTLWFGALFLFIPAALIFLAKYKKKKIPLIVTVGFSWLLLAALYYSLFGPHLPANDMEIRVANRSHHLAYLGSIGSLIIWGYLLYQAVLKIKTLKKPYGNILSTLLVVGVSVLNYVWLTGQYDRFLELPKGIKIVRQKFFFDTYRKYIPETAEKVNIYYDESYLKRKDNFRPNDGYYWAFWDRDKVKIITGIEELQKYLTDINDSQKRNYEINNLYYIYTDYDDGLIEDNLSRVLRNSILSPQKEKLSNQLWKPIWGQSFGQHYIPEIIKSDNLKLTYFKNPVVFINNLNFPAIFPPTLKISLNVNIDSNTKSFIDLRAGILSHFLNYLNLPTNEQLNSLVKYYEEKPGQTEIDFNNVLNTPSVKERMVCGEKKDDNGVVFLISWVGEPDSYYSNLSKETKENIFSPFYTQRFYSLCYFPNIVGRKDIEIDLPYVGSILRGVVIIPLTKYPISLDVVSSSLDSFRILNK